MTNSFVFRYDRRISRPRVLPPFFDGVAIHAPLSELDADLDAAVLLSGVGLRNMTFLNRRNRTGELTFFAASSGPPPSLRARVRYSDGIQSIDDEIATAIAPWGALTAEFLESGRVRLRAPTPLAITSALEDPRFYAVTPEGAGDPLRIVSVARERHRRDHDPRRIREVDDPVYLELAIEPPASGPHRLAVPALRTAAGGFVGPVRLRFQARVVKRRSFDRSLGPFAPRPGSPSDVVFGAIAAEDERIGGARA